MLASKTKEDPLEMVTVNHLWDTILKKKKKIQIGLPRAWEKQEQDSEEEK